MTWTKPAGNLWQLDDGISSSAAVLYHENTFLAQFGEERKGHATLKQAKKWCERKMKKATR